MAPKQKLFADIGAVEKRGDEYRAHVQYRSQDGQNKHIHGPDRSDEASAKKDLARMGGKGSFGLKSRLVCRLLLKKAVWPIGLRNWAL
mgnify:CR=1 FL=1